MKAYLMVALLFVSMPATAQSDIPGQPPKQEPSFREQIKASLAKQKADEDNGPKQRPWDRDAQGRRPWEIPATPPDRSKP
jgi:hypothetical protein